MPLSPASSTASPAPLGGQSDDAASRKASRLDVAIAVIVFAVLAVGRWSSAHSHPWNPDEPQHLHVVWAWTAGLLPYRDVFDNHTPLFQWLASPLLRWFGERPDIVVLMRLAILPLFGISLWLTYRVGALLYSQRTALWAALLAGCYPEFFFRMGEFRTDVLWTVLWLAVLVVLVGGRLTAKRLFFAGLLLGAAMSVSMKTSLLLLTLLLAGGFTWLAHHRSTVQAPGELAWTKKAPPLVAAALIGLLIVPSAFVLYFAAKGALQPMYYCVIQHNTLPGENLWMVLARRMLSRRFLVMMIVLALGAAMLPLLNWNASRWTPRLFFLLVTGLFHPLLNGLWPVVTQQDYLPWIPLVAVHSAAILVLVGDRFNQRWRSWMPRCFLPVIILAIEGGLILKHEPILNRHRSDRQIQALATVLKLADPGEYVMDAKGETIFRRRPYYFVLESLTMRQLSRGTLIDDIPARLIETRTAVVRLSDRMPAGTQEFIARNYLSVGHARVLGKMLAPARDGVIHFQIAVPERYSLESPAGAISGNLDGQKLNGPRWLDTGEHELVTSAPAIGAAVVWARAGERGFTPFRGRETKSGSEE